jgi:hypothetical protein
MCGALFKAPHQAFVTLNLVSVYQYFWNMVGCFYSKYIRRFTMKVSKIALACTMALAAMSAQAVPGIPATPPTVFVSGASGVDSFFKGVAATAVGYVPNVSGVFIHDLSNNYYGYYGLSTNAATGVAAGQPLLILKRSAGGSAQGVGPLSSSTPSAVADWTVAGTPDVGTTNSYLVTLTSGAANVVPGIGVSDVEPKMFSGINQEFGVPVLTASQLAGLTVSPWAQLAEGIAVTKAVPETFVLTNNFVREALDGHYFDWSKADPSATPSTDPMVICRRVEGSGTQAAYNSYFNSFPNTSAFNGYGKVLPAITSDSAGYNATGLDLSPAGLLAGAGSATNPIMIDPSLGFTVFEGSGSGDVRKCLQAAQMGVDTIPLVGRDNLNYVLQFSLVGVPSKAIGVLSLDSYTSVSTAAKRDAAVNGVDGLGYGADNTYVATNANASTSVATPGLIVGNGEWNFRNLNGSGVFDVKTQTITSATSSGIAPSRVNLLNNLYDFTVEPTVQKRTLIGTTLPTQFALNNAFYSYLTSKLGAPADMVDPNPNNTAPLAYVAVPTATNVKGTASPTNLIADLTRQGVTAAPLHVRQ